MRIVEKPWGREIWVAHTDKYALKIIELKKGKRCSLHYHPVKHEHMYVDQGSAQMEFEDDHGKMETRMLKAGEVIEYKPNRKHRILAVEDLRLFEVSTPELGPDDVIRIEDDYGRES